MKATQTANGNFIMGPDALASRDYNSILEGSIYFIHTIEKYETQHDTK